MKIPRRRDVRVAVLGAGLGGVATAVKLKQANVESFTVFERAAGPGGVWWHNTYPGCEVDVPSHAYSYSFMTYDWSGTHASQAELQGYVEAVIDRFGIRENFRFATTVSSIRWDETVGRYAVRTDQGDTGFFDVVVSCLGLLSEPYCPTWSGLESFEGPVFHTSRYEHDHNLAGRRVAIVGTGSTACQLAPALAPIVGHLDLYQREPAYILPKPSRPFTDEERARFRRFPITQKIDRIKLFREANKLAPALEVDSELQQKTRAFCIKYIKKSVHDPETAKALTPTYPFGCKRPVLASTFYPMFNRDNVTLIPNAVTAITPTGVVDATGTERPADVLIMATGYQATNFLATVDVIGPSGRSLHETWAGEPSAFLGITVSGFPNFFMVYGPNTNGGWSIVAQLERQAEVAVRAVRRLRRGPTMRIDTRPAVAEAVDRWVQREIGRKLSALSAGCHNYYHSAEGRNVTQWPRNHPAYYAATKILPLLGLTARKAR